jgi:alkylmercury lyase
VTGDREPALPLGASEGNSGLTLDEVAVARAAFESLRAGGHPTIEDLTSSSGLSRVTVDEVVGDFVRTGRAQLDGDGCLIGIVGLTTEATRHRLVLDGAPLFTWCAFDAVGIPAALQVDAAVFTTCGYCEGPIEVDIEKGSVPNDSPLRGWLPLMENCENVRTDFCPEANLFCSNEHLGAWRVAAGMPEGLVMDLGALTALGHRSWGAVSAAR